MKNTMTNARQQQITNEEVMAELARMDARSAQRQEEVATHVAEIRRLREESDQDRYNTDQRVDKLVYNNGAISHDQPREATGQVPQEQSNDICHCEIF